MKLKDLMDFQERTLNQHKENKGLDSYNDTSSEPEALETSLEFADDDYTPSGMPDWYEEAYLVTEFAHGRGEDTEIDVAEDLIGERIEMYAEASVITATAMQAECDYAAEVSGDYEGDEDGEGDGGDSDGEEC
jgi:hypothetical protein